MPRYLVACYPHEACKMHSGVQSPSIGKDKTSFSDGILSADSVFRVIMTFK